MNNALNLLLQNGLEIGDLMKMQLPYLKRDARGDRGRH